MDRCLLCSKHDPSAELLTNDRGLDLMGFVFVALA